MHFLNSCVTILGPSTCPFNFYRRFYQVFIELSCYFFKFKIESLDAMQKY